MKPYLSISLLLLLGCGPVGQSGAGGTSGDDGSSSEMASTNMEPEGPVDADLLTVSGSCVDGVDPKDIKDTLMIVADFEQSAHEMVACGGLTFALIVALVDVVITLATNPGASTIPDTFTYDADTHSYTARATNFGQTTMRIHFYQGDAEMANLEESLIKDDLFRGDNYLVRAKAKPNILEGKVEISYEKAGPLVALLGYGDDPPNPLKLSINDAGKLADGVRDLKFKMVVEFNDEGENGVTTTYTVDSPLAIVGSALTNSLLDTTLISAAANRDEPNQELTVDEWTVKYVDGEVGALDGKIGFKVDGKHFPFLGLFEYEDSGWPKITLSCP